MAEEPNALLSKLTDQFDLDKVKTIAPDEGHPDNDWLVIFWQDLHFGVVNIDSTYDGENVELKSGQPLSFGDKMHALYGPELLKAIFITRVADDKTGYELAKTLISAKKRKRKATTAKKCEGQNDDKEVKSDSETLDDNLKVKKKGQKKKKEEKKSANETLDDNLKVKKKVIREENKKKAELRGKVAYEKARSMFSEIRNVHDQPQVDNTNPSNSDNLSEEHAPSEINNPSSQPSPSSQSKIISTNPDHNKQPEVVLPNKVCLASQNATNTPTELEASNLNNLLVNSNPTFNIQSNFNPSMQTNQLHRPVSSYPYHQNSMFNQYNNRDSFANNFQSSYPSFPPYWQNSSPILSNPYQGNTFSNLHHPQPMRPTSTCSLYNPFKIMHEVENQSDQSLTNMNESTNTNEIDASVSPDSDSDIEDPGDLHSNSVLSTTNTSSNVNYNCTLCHAKEEKIKVLTIQLANAKQDIENMKLDIDSNNGADARPLEPLETNFINKRMRGRICTTEYKILDENLQMPPGYQYLVEGSPLAVQTDWYKTTLYSLRKKDRPCALKMIIDCFLTPEQYGIRGGTSAFSKTPLAGVMTSVENFALIHFKMLPSDVTRAINEKMYSGRRLMKRNAH